MNDPQQRDHHDGEAPYDFADLERRLRALPLAQPSPLLRRRIFGGPARRAGRRRWTGRRIPIGWAALLMLAAALAGYLAAGGRGDRPRERAVRLALPSPTLSPTPVRVHQVHESAPSANFLDFTQPSPDFLPGEVTVSVQTGSEV